MGQGPSVTFQLVDSTPYRLRYLLTATGEAGITTLPNAAGATPDLRTDADSATPGSGRNPMLEIVSTGVANQAEARRLLMGEEAAPPNIVNTGFHARSTVMPRNPAGVWLLDAGLGIGGSAGFPVIAITPPAGAQAGDAAYLDIWVQHSFNE